MAPDIVVGLRFDRPHNGRGRRAESIWLRPMTADDEADAFALLDAFDILEAVVQNRQANAGFRMNVRDPSRVMRYLAMFAAELLADQFADPLEHIGEMRAEFAAWAQTRLYPDQ
jgi:hypothetical protein